MNCQNKLNYQWLWFLLFYLRLFYRCRYIRFSSIFHQLDIFKLSFWSHYWGI